MSLNLRQVLQHDNLAELVMSIEVVADLMYESGLTDVVDAADMHERAWALPVRQRLDNLVQIHLVSDV